MLATGGEEHMTTQYALHDAARLRGMADRCRDLARVVLQDGVRQGLQQIVDELESMAMEKERGAVDREPG